MEHDFYEWCASQSRYACVVDQKAAGFPVTKACEIAEVSTSGSYDWCFREMPTGTLRLINQYRTAA